ncbi:MAG: response regulator transcription factor [Rhodocyclaceae bacterium]|nr:response regulator transcription factor [Rhodocyclaceae bacterium]
MRILVADDHPLYRDAVCRLLSELDPDAVVASAESLEAVRSELAADSPVDLLLIDLRMPGSEGFPSIAALHRDHPGVPIFVVSGSDSPLDPMRARRAGTLGFVSKSASPETMRATLAALLDGSWEPLALEAKAPVHLTPRQLDVLQGMAAGQPNKRIALNLGLTEGTVKLHVAAVLEALGVANRTQAVVRAQELGLL